MKMSFSDCLIKKGIINKNKSTKSLEKYVKKKTNCLFDSELES